ncbi:MAG: peptidylprolyl isomerase [Betaproteobacteria bacterium]|nr:peptidylprolyl isomerase [Betaproteobacteria bacterium]
MRTHHKTLPLVAAALAASLGTLPASSQEAPALIVNGEEIPKAVIDQIVERNQIETEDAAQRFAVQVLAAQEAEKLGLKDDARVKQAVRMAEIEVLSRAYIESQFDQIEVDEDDVKAEYETFATEQEGKNEYLVRHILVQDEEQAKELQAEIDGDEEVFADLAREHSVDTGSGAEGGSLGWVLPELFVKPFADALLALEEDEISEPVETQFGWHIIMLEDEREAKVPSFEQIRPQIENQIKNVRFAEHMEELQADADIQLPEEE